MQVSRAHFAPVELKARHDGWTAARQRRFIEVLGATKSVTKACAVVGMSRMSAYKLRDRAEARQFCFAWRDALRPGFDQRGTSGRILRRAMTAKVDDVEEVHASPKTMHHGQSTLSALQTLQTYLAQLRAEDEELGSNGGE